MRGNIEALMHMHWGFFGALNSFSAMVNDNFKDLAL